MVVVKLQSLADVDGWDRTDRTNVLGSNLHRN